MRSIKDRSRQLAHMPFSLPGAKENSIEKYEHALVGDSNNFSSDVSIFKPKLTTALTQEPSHRRGSTASVNNNSSLMVEEYRPEVRDAITAFVTGRH